MNAKVKAVSEHQSNFLHYIPLYEIISDTRSLPKGKLAKVKICGIYSTCLISNRKGVLECEFTDGNAMISAGLYRALTENLYHLVTQITVV